MTGVFSKLYSFILGREDDNLDDEEGLDISQESDNLQDNTLVTSTVTHDPSSLSRMGPPLPPEINMKIPANHFDFGAIFPQLSLLEEFHVCYKVIQFHCKVLYVF